MATNHLDDFLSNASIVHSHRVINEGLRSKNQKIAPVAEGKKEEYIKDGLFKDVVPDNDAPAFTKNSFNALSKKDKGETKKAVWEGRHDLALERGINLVRTEHDAIFKKGGAYDENYATLASDLLSAEKEVGPVVPSGGRKLVNLFANFENYTGLAKRVEDGDDLSSEEEGMVKDLAYNGAYTAQVDKMKPKGWTAGSRGYAGNLEGMAARGSKENMAAGARELAKQTEDKMRDLVGDHYKVATAGHVAGALDSMVNSGKSDQEELAASFVYKAHEGHLMGLQDFVKEFADDL